MNDKNRQFWKPLLQRVTYMQCITQFEDIGTSSTESCQSLKGKEQRDAKQAKLNIGSLVYEQQYDQVCSDFKMKSSRAGEALHKDI